MSDAYDALVDAIGLSVKLKVHSPATNMAVTVGLVELGDGKPKQKYDYERHEGDQSLYFQWRWYDQSQAFSYRPDRNILSVTLKKDGVVQKSHSDDFED